MIKLKSIIILTTILILIFSIINYHTYAADPLSEFMGLMKENPAGAVDKVVQNPAPDAITQYGGTGEISQVTPASTGSLSSGVNLQDIIGSYDVLVVTGKIIGGVIVSPKDNNAVTTFNPLTGDVIV